MIRSFAYEDLDTGWKLEGAHFDSLNLLVGPSGAGKTQILTALLNLRRAGLVGVEDVPSARWELILEVAGSTYTWQVETKVTFAKGPAPDLGTSTLTDTDARIVTEKIEKDTEILVERGSESSFRFKEKSLPKITHTESAISLMADEDDLRPLHEALRLWRLLEVPLLSSGAIASVEDAERTREKHAGKLDRLNHDTASPAFLKLYVLQQDHPDVFRQIVDSFSDIFPTVEALAVATYDHFDFKPDLGADYMANKLALGIREEGVETWIPHRFLSSGMTKTLIFLIEASLAAEGSVFLIDELENSLGVDCLPEVAGLMLRGLDRIQYIATSHHPRVINEIPYRRWKLVTRRGSTVRVLPAVEIPALQTASPLEKFTQLINLPEYEEGVA